MPSSTQIPSHRFLLDENVRRELAEFLKKKGLAVKLATKGSRDSQLAVTSKTEKLVVVTNDEDFSEYTKDEVFSVVWLRIPQHDLQSLTVSFGKLLAGIKNFSGRLVILTEKGWEDFSLVEEQKPHKKLG